MSKFTQRIREYREMKGVSQLQMCRDLGLTKSVVSMWETGVREPSLEMLVKIIKYLDADANYILGIVD